jgi:hypothetical protein
VGLLVGARVANEVVHEAVNVTNAKSCDSNVALDVAHAEAVDWQLAVAAVQEPSFALIADSRCACGSSRCR